MFLMSFQCCLQDSQWLLFLALAHFCMFIKVDWEVMDPTAGRTPIRGMKGGRGGWEEGFLVAPAHLPTSYKWKAAVLHAQSESCPTHVDGFPANPLWGHPAWGMVCLAQRPGGLIMGTPPPPLQDISTFPNGLNGHSVPVVHVLFTKLCLLFGLTNFNIIYWNVIFLICCFVFLPPPPPP